MVPSSFYDETVNLVNGAFITVKLIDLKPYSLYNITVQAVTEFGSSDLAVVTGRTNEGGKQYAQSLLKRCRDALHTYLSYIQQVFQVKTSWGTRVPLNLMGHQGAHVLELLASNFSMYVQ